MANPRRYPVSLFVRTTHEQAEQVNEYAAEHELGQAEAVRLLLKEALDNNGYPERNHKP